MGVKRSHLSFTMCGKWGKKAKQESGRTVERLLQWLRQGMISPTIVVA